MQSWGKDGVAWCSVSRRPLHGSEGAGASQTSENLLTPGDSGEATPLLISTASRKAPGWFSNLRVPALPAHSVHSALLSRF